MVNFSWSNGFLFLVTTIFN